MKNLRCFIEEHAVEVGVGLGLGATILSAVALHAGLSKNVSEKISNSIADDSVNVFDIPEIMGHVVVDSKVEHFDTIAEFDQSTNQSNIFWVGFVVKD